MAGGFVEVVAPDGQLGEIPEEQLQGALEAGFRLPGEPSAAPAAEPAAERSVRVVAPDGEAGEIPASQVDAAVRAGFKLQSDIDREAEFGTAGQQLATFGEGIAQGVSLGAQSPLAGLEGFGDYLGRSIAEIGMPEEEQLANLDQSVGRAQEQISAREDVNPITSGLGQATGIIGSTIATGGAGALGRAAALTPTGAIARLGAAGATQAAARVAPTLARGLARPAVGLLAAGAIEGAAFDAAREIDDSVRLEQWDNLAERAVARAWEGAKIGSLTSLGVGGLLSGLGAGARRLRGGGQADDAAGALARRADDAPLASVDVVAPERPWARAVVDKARAAAGAADDAQQAGTRAIRKDMDELLVLDDELEHLAGLEAKRRTAREYDGTDFFADPSEELGQLRATQDRLRELLADQGEAALQDGGGLSAIKRLIGKKDGIGHAINRAEQFFIEGKAGSGYLALDDAKRLIQKAARTNNSTVQAVLREEAERLRPMLEDVGKWERMAERQKLANPAWAERISRESDQRLGGFFVRSGKRSYDPFEPLRQTNDATVGGVLRQLGKAEVQGTEEAYRQWLRAVRADVRARTQAWGTPALQEKAARIEQLASSIEQTMDDVALVARDAEAWRNTVGILPENWKGPAAGAARFASTTAIEAASALQTRLNKSLTVKAMKKGIEAASKAAPAAPRLATYAQIQSRLESVVSEESPQRQQFERDLRELEQEAPALAAAMAQAQQRRDQFLVSLAGPVAAEDLAEGRAPTLDAARRRDIALAMEALDDPDKAVERIARGELRPIDVEVLRAVYPTIFADMQAKIIERLKSAKDIPYAVRKRVSLALSVPADRLHRPKSVAWLQSLAAPRAQAEPERGDMPSAPPRKMEGPGKSSITREQRATR